MKISRIASIIASIVFAVPAFGQSHYTAVPLPADQRPVIAPPADSPGTTIDWETIDGGGRVLSLGSLSFEGSVGQADAGTLSGGSLQLAGGYWPGVEYAATCYPDCDGSGSLTANDFACFLNRFNSGHPAANCDGSIVAPTLNALDFICFMNKYASGCN